jgi:hypothetical protein
MFKLNQSYYDRDKSRGMPYVGNNTWRLVLEWNRCREDPKRNTTKLFKMLDPEIRHWVKMFEDPHYPRNIHFATLFHLIEAEDKAETLSNWIENHRDCLYDIFFDLFLGLLRAPPHVINVKPKQYAFLLSRLFIYRLSHKIRDWARKTKTIDSAICTIETSYIENHDITEILNRIKETDLYLHYLTELYLMNGTEEDFKAVTKNIITAQIFWRTLNEWKNQEGIDE